MDKILVTIYVISIEEEYDILLPIGLMMKDAVQLIQETIKDLSNNTYNVNPSAVLYTDDGFLINLNNSVKFSGLKNGYRVILK